MSAPQPPSAFILEKSAAAWQALQDQLDVDAGMVSDEFVSSPRLPRTDGQPGTLPHPRILLERAIDAAIWTDRRAEESDNLRKRFTTRRDRYQQRSDAIRTTIEQLLALLGLDAHEADLGSASMRKRPQAVEITDIAVVPTTLKKTEVVITPDKVTIGKMLKAGETVPGAALSEPRVGLTIIPF
jgi:hypothetical protein